MALKTDDTPQKRVTIRTMLDSLEPTSDAIASAISYGVHIESMLCSARLQCHDLRRMILEMSKVIGPGDPTCVALKAILFELE